MQLHIIPSPILSFFFCLASSASSLCHINPGQILGPECYTVDGGTDLKKTYEYHRRPPPPELAPGIIRRAGALASDDQCMVHWESYKMPRY